MLIIHKMADETMSVPIDVELYGHSVCDRVIDDSFCFMCTYDVDSTEDDDMMRFMQHTRKVTSSFCPTKAVELIHSYYEQRLRPQLVLDVNGNDVHAPEWSKTSILQHLQFDSSSHLDFKIQQQMDVQFRIMQILANGMTDDTNTRIDPVRLGQYNTVFRTMFSAYKQLSSHSKS
jgi:hypothetical protein